MTYHLTRPVLATLAALALSLGVGACGSDDAQAGATDAAVAPAAEGTAEIGYSTEPDTRSAEEIVAEMNAGGRVGQLEALPAERLAELGSQVTKIDLIFFTQGVSMSLDNPQAVGLAIGAIGAEQATRRDNCQPVGRMFFSAGTKSLGEADVFFRDGCTYFEIFEGKKPAYANVMTPGGKEFFNNNLGQALPGFTRVK